MAIDNTVGECRKCKIRKNKSCLMSEAVTCPVVGHPKECPLLPENKDLETTLQFSDDGIRLVDTCPEETDINMWVALNAIYASLSQKQQVKASKLFNEVLGEE